MDWIKKQRVKGGRENVGRCTQAQDYKGHTQRMFFMSIFFIVYFVCVGCIEKEGGKEGPH